MSCCHAPRAFQARQFVHGVVRGILLLPIALGAPIRAQSVPARTAAPPTFEIATVKPLDAKNPHPASVLISGDRFAATGMSVKELIKIAYDKNYGADRQVSGGPAWIGTSRFDVEAKLDTALSEQLHQLSSKERGEELRQMLRGLLADRFKLRVHHTSSRIPVYELVIAKGGPKLLPTFTTISSNKQDGSDAPALRFAGKGVIEGNGANSETLGTALSMQPEIGGRLVIDKTGLKGKYNFTLKWSPDSVQGVDATGTDGGPSLFTALQEQIGLRLEAAKDLVDVIVVDHVELPNAN